MQSTSIEHKLLFRHPNKDDGVAIHRLIDACKPLDLNSVYNYLLLCTHFSSSCLVAELDGEIQGFVSGYIKPAQAGGDPEIFQSQDASSSSASTYFLWQIAIGAPLRGQGMGLRLIEQVLASASCAQVQALETSITPSNQASWALFRSFARQRQASLQSADWFSAAQLGGEHEPEHLLRISWA
ncbi:L-2,4-diaminobutyric acid acetyltransferase [Allopseudospirillum japonicum]|uniref:L-2,4-diaminobutyric acid acetyltransferase n=1 Tax=Allopseudospirillum japonicum TaxID=64971 RepID=A0A1H6TVG4_9GAMM|nr:diaminobutyrate acetyltransferase [Allopseudospirillum japonicum]SEI84029.1 L-2,4-diaminobutyric acid acetyltransferase [Allopseudospirillum japonicum]